LKKTRSPLNEFENMITGCLSFDMDVDQDVRDVVACSLDFACQNWHIFIYRNTTILQKVEDKGLELKHAWVKKYFSTRNKKNKKC
jgi:hypothetical protein